MPSFVADRRHPQAPAQRGDAMGGPVRAHELASLDGMEPVSLANQAAAFLGSPVLRGGSCSPAAAGGVPRARQSSGHPSAGPRRSACASQLRMVWADGSNCSASDSGVRPLRTSSTVRHRNSGWSGGRVFGIVDFLPHRGTMSTEAGQLHSARTAIRASALPAAGSQAIVDRKAPVFST